MRRVMVGIGCLLCIFLVTACETVMGPPGSEPVLPEAPPLAGPPYDMLIEGPPPGNIFAAMGGFFIWKTGDSLHVRIVHERGRRVAIPRDVFNGAIGIEGGVFIPPERQSLRPPDTLRFIPHEVGFDLELEDYVKGFDVTIRPTAPGYRYCITVSVGFNGVADPRVVHLGRSAHVPQTLPIRMCFYRR